MPRSLPLLLVSGILVLTLGGGLAYVAHDAAASGATGLDAFADAVARGYGGDRVDAALSLADLEREPVELIAQGSRERFDRGQEAELAARARALVEERYDWSACVAAHQEYYVHALRRRGVKC